MCERRAGARSLGNSFGSLPGFGLSNRGGTILRGGRRLTEDPVGVRQLSAVLDSTSGGALSGHPPEGMDRPTKTILLLDYSGSMFGGYGRSRVANCSACVADLVAGEARRNDQIYYYEDPLFETFLATWLAAATPAGSGQDLEILLFNAQLWRLDEMGEVVPYGGFEPLAYPRSVGRATPAEIVDWLHQIPDSPFSVDRSAANTTESRAALQSVIDAIPDEAVVWLVTDNIVDTGGGAVSAADARRNLEFYDLLRSDPRLQAVVAYPLHQSKACDWMCGTSLFAYGMYVSRYERPTSEELHRLDGTGGEGGGPTAEGLLWNRELREIAARSSGRTDDLAGVPLRLKPIDTDVLSFEFELEDGQAVRCDPVAEYGDPLRCLVRVEIRNTLRHQTVESAELTFTNGTFLPRKANAPQRLPWVSAVCSGEMRGLGWRLDGGDEHPGDEPIVLAALEPLQSTVVEFLFELPPIHVAADRNNFLEVALTDRILLDGRIGAELRNIRTRLAVDSEGLEEVYGAAELPEIFRGRLEGRMQSVFQTGAAVANNGQILGLLVLLVAGGAILLTTLVVMRFQRIHLTVEVNGMEAARLSLPRLSSRSFELDAGSSVRVTRRWSSRFNLRPGPGLRLRKDGHAWLLTRTGMEEETRVEIRRGWRSAAARRRTVSEEGW